MNQIPPVLGHAQLQVDGIDEPCNLRQVVCFYRGLNNWNRVPFKGFLKGIYSRVL